MMPISCPHAACPTESIEVFSDQLVNLTETACISHGVLDSSSPGPFARNLPFGFRWTDNTPKNCTIYTITIAVQAGVSCTGLPQGGNTTLNGVPTGSLYRFPYVNEYDGVCSCTPVYSPIQVRVVPPPHRRPLHKVTVQTVIWGICAESWKQ